MVNERIDKGVDQNETNQKPPRIRAVLFFQFNPINAIPTQSNVRYDSAIQYAGYRQRGVNQGKQRNP